MTNKLPQTPRFDDRVIRLDTPSLDKLFGGSLPKHPPLTETQSRVASMMQKAGRDAAAIAARVGASLASVTDYLERLARVEQARVELAANPRKGAYLGAPSSTIEPADDIQLEESDTIAAPAREPERLPVSVPQLQPRDEHPSWPNHDIELTELQRKFIRGMRRIGIPVDALARKLRISPAQIERICIESPNSAVRLESNKTQETPIEHQ